MPNIEIQPTTIKTMAVADLVFRDDLYPRLQKDAATIQRYADVLALLPPIEINQKNEVIDGWNRSLAHRKAGKLTINAFVTPTAGDSELLEFAIERNARHGLQLSQEDKREVAQRIYSGTPMEERGAKKQRLAHLLSVDLTTVQKWLSKTDGDDKERRDVTAFNLWLACHTQEEIAARLGISHQAVAKLPFLQPDGNFRFVAKVGQLREIEDPVNKLPAPVEFGRRLTNSFAGEQISRRWENFPGAWRISYRYENRRTIRSTERFWCGRFSSVSSGASLDVGLETVRYRLIPDCFSVRWSIN
jgi:hypothetical protein